MSDPERWQQPRSIIEQELGRIELIAASIDAMEESIGRELDEEQIDQMFDLAAEMARRGREAGRASQSENN